MITACALLGLLHTHQATAQPSLRRQPSLSSGRGNRVVLLNEGNGTHIVRLHDHNDAQWHDYFVGPQDEVVTNRLWESDTEIYIDGHPMGNIQNGAQRDRLGNEKVWAVYFEHHNGWDIEHHDGWMPAHVYYR